MSLYVHFPWCVRKCPYCDFNSYALRDALPEAPYLEALERDLEAQAPEVAGREIGTVFLGGGTPSLFSPAAIGRFLERARALLRVDAGAEVTLEANPGTVERGRFAEYAAAGITRVSLGAQSFDAGQLAALGRIHSPGETRRAAEELHAAGLANFNLDLMYGLPGQEPAGAVRDIEAALALAPAHLSHYQLTIEPGTVFAARPPPAVPDDEQSLVMLERCQERLGAAGFAQYEVSAYARAGRRCRHNLNYWSYGDYLGIGAGAHGKLTTAARAILRTVQPREPRRYLAAAPVSFSRAPVPEADRPFEFMLNALRLVEGFELALYEARTGLPASGVLGRLHSLVERGLVETAAARWRASERGRRFLNDLLLEFLPSAGTGVGAE